MRRKLLVATAFVAVLAASSSIAFYQTSSVQSPANQNPASDQETAWVCPMHPDYTMDVTGKCPRCGMDLVRAAPFDVRDYSLDFQTVPALVRPGQKTSLRFKILHPGTGDPIKKF